MTMTPHDSLFKAVFSQPERAAEELRHVLAPELAASIDFTTLRHEQGSFVDEELREHHTDLLLSAAIAGRTVRIYVLFEHQSSVDPWMPLRLLTYMLRVWEALRQAEPEARRLPPIVPVVLHHSETGWRAARCFEALVELPDGAPAALLEHVPKFRFALDDLSHDEALASRKTSAYTRLVLSALRDARRKAFGELLRSLIELLREAGREIPAVGRERSVFWRYLLEVRGLDEYAAADKSVLDPDQEATVQSIADMFREEGRQKGLQEGLADMLLGLLTQRFGEVPEPLVRRVRAAGPELLQRWCLRVLAARSVDEVLEA